MLLVICSVVFVIQVVSYLLKFHRIVMYSDHSVLVVLYDVGFLFAISVTDRDNDLMLLIEHSLFWSPTEIPIIHSIILLFFQGNKKQF